MTIDQTFNFRRVSDRVTTSGLVNAEQLATLGGEGYRAVINLLPDSYEHAVHDEATIVRDQGLDYVHIPVDYAAPTHADLEAFAEAMDARSGRKVHVHCAANYRVSVFCAMYALQNGSCTEDEAMELIRDVWDPAGDAVWTAFIADERNRTPR